MAINIQSAPRPNASLAAIDYSDRPRFAEAGQQAILNAKNLRSERIRNDAMRLNDTYQKNQITQSEVLAMISQDESVFDNLDEGSPIKKSYDKITKGNPTPQDFNNLFSYINAANKQQQFALEKQNSTQNRAVEIAIAQVLKDVAAENSAEGVKVGNNEILTVGMQVANQIEDENVRAAVTTQIFNMNNKAMLGTEDTASIKDYKFTEKQYEEIRELIQDDDYAKAKDKLRAMGVKLTYEDAAGNIIDVSNAILEKRFADANPENNKDVLSDLPVEASTIVYGDNNNKKRTIESYSSGDQELTMTGNPARGTSFNKVTKSAFENLTVDAQKTYLEKFGEDFLDTTSEVTGSNSNIKSINFVN